jgi:hypothetical protein
MINGSIKTKAVESVLEKREMIKELKSRIDVIKAELHSVQNDLEYKEVEMIAALKQGTLVVSKVYNLALKEHELQNCVNWQKEFGTLHPDEYVNIKAQAGKRFEYELLIARKERV